MITSLIIVHVIILFALVGLVLLHRSKGSNMGVSFGGGASQTVFGSAGPASFVAKTISVLGALFFITSMALSIVWKQDSGQGQLVDKVTGFGETVGAVVSATSSVATGSGVESLPK